MTFVLFKNIFKKFFYVSFSVRSILFSLFFYETFFRNIKGFNLTILFRDYQIIVVGMLPGTDDERVYMERWAIRFNGNTKSECFIDFQGYTEYANVSFSDWNSMCFASTFPGCQSQQQFYMRNITRHTIQ